MNKTLTIAASQFDWLHGRLSGYLLSIPWKQIIGKGFSTLIFLCFEKTPHLWRWDTSNLLAVPLCLFCSVLILGFEWLNGAVERYCYTVANGGFTDKELRTFSDSGKVIFEGSIDNKRLRLIEWSVGAFSGFRYRLLLTEEKGPYCYKVIRYVELPYGCNPTLIVLKDGSYELQITNRSGVEVFRRDVREVLNGTGVVSP